MKFPYRKVARYLLSPTTKRNKVERICIAIALFVLFAVFASNTNLFFGGNIADSNAQLIEGKVVKVIDGDTIDVLDSTNTKHRIRFYGIDAPEKKQAYGQKAREFLAGMIAGMNVWVVVKDKDRYGRTVGKVMLKNELGDGELDINREMVRNGFAHAYRQYSKDYIADEEQARNEGLGLWQDKHPITPSDFRKAHQ